MFKTLIFFETDFVYETIWNVSKFEMLAERTQNFSEPMQYLKRTETIQTPKLKKLA